MRRIPSTFLALALASSAALADEHRVVAPPAALLAVAAAPAAADTTDLKFRDFFALPVGPKGLAPSPRLLALAGQRVRIVGYMARQDEPNAGLMILAPLPVVLGDEDEAYADDLPASALYVHLAEADRAHSVHWMPGLLSVSGVLQVGATREADGRMSFVRLQLDPVLSQAVVAAH
jgi:hypothetical protein